MIKRVLSKLRKVTMSLFAVLCAGAVWAEEGDVTYVTTPMDDPSAGYIRTGLGKKGNEVAVVFTNHTKTATWTVPANLRNVEFLVVGGGGGGGADSNSGAAFGGAGGGGGGVAIGNVDLTKDATVAITIGAGGAGGKVQANQMDGASSGKYYGASKKGGDTTFAVNGATYVIAYGGGRDQGVSTIYTTGTPRVGGPGGSNAGSRGGYTTVQPTDPKMGYIDDSNAALRNCTTYGNKGGKGCSVAFYGYPSAGGGGGANPDSTLGAGGDAGNGDDWPGGKGGEGLTSTITGELRVYGSGGGGASTQGTAGGEGGEGAGTGGDRAVPQGTSGLANQGGGGGGSSRAATYGGNGGSGIVVLRYSVYEAEVVTAEGSTPYATFAEAFDAAQAGETVKLLNDVTLAEKLTIKKAVTLDLNGCTLSETVTDNYGALYVGTAGNLTITDSAEGGKIATDGGVVVGNYGTVTVEGGTIEAGAVAEDDVAVYNFYYNGSTYGKLTVNGGKVGRIWNCGNANITAGEVVDIDNSGAMTIAEDATVSGTVIIKNGSDAAEVPGAGTLTAPESLTVQVGNEGAEAFYVDGKWLVQVVVATIGEAKFVSLDVAIAAAGAEDEVVVVADIATDAAFEITKKVAVNLNGKTIATTQADTEGNGVFWVKTGGELTLNGEGTINGVGGNIYNIAIWADGGKVTINGGTYTNEGAQDSGPDGDHFDLIYAKNGGSVEINGGTFKCETPNWTLNSHDTAKGTIVVKGGTFYQFNPANCTTEGANTNFCADGLTAVLNEETGYYEIVDAWTAPMPEKDGEADITEEYTPEVLAALEAALATSVDVKVNGVELKGDEAVKALNAAVASFDNALTFDGTAATLDIEIEVTEVNAEDPAASTVVVKRGTDELTVKATPKVKYFYPETKTWGSDKPESGAVLFKLVFEAPSAN